MNAHLLPNRCTVLIVGGGIQGLSLAFSLAERGVKGILVLDAGYWQGGASGRNGTLIRGAFSSGLLPHSRNPDSTASMASSIVSIPSTSSARIKSGMPLLLPRTNNPNICALH